MAWHLPPLTPHFEAALRDVRAQAPDARVRAAQRLSLAEGEERDPARKALEQLAIDTHPGVRATALAGLAEIGGDGNLDAVLDRIDDPSPEVRELAVLALGRIGGERAERVLRDALRSEAAEVRFQAVAGLADLRGEEALGDVLACIADDDPKVRAQVAEALGSLSAAHARGHLVRLLDDPERMVRREAALALARLGDPRAEAELVAAVEERDRLHEVCLALGPIAGQAGRAALAALAERILVGASVRLTAAAGLVLAADPRGEAGLQRGLASFWYATRSCAVDLVGRVRCTALASGLGQLARRPRGADPEALTGALIALADAGADVGDALRLLAAREGEAGAAARRFLEESHTIPQ